MPKATAKVEPPMISDGAQYVIARNALLQQQVGAHDVGHEGEGAEGCDEGLGAEAEGGDVEEGAEYDEEEAEAPEEGGGVVGGGRGEEEVEG